MKTNKILKVSFMSMMLFSLSFANQKQSLVMCNQTVINDTASMTNIQRDNLNLKTLGIKKFNYTAMLNAAKNYLTPYKNVKFTNNIPFLSILSDNPQNTALLIKNWDFTVNGQVIPPDETKNVTLKERVFTFAGKQQGRLGLIATFIKRTIQDKSSKMTDWLKAAGISLLSLLPAKFSYECALNEQDLNETVELLDLIAQHEEINEISKGGSFSTIISFLKKHIAWPDDFIINLKLPRLKTESA